jgi:hypothetical protein
MIARWDLVVTFLGGSKSVFPSATVWTESDNNITTCDSLLLLLIRLVA